MNANLSAVELCGRRWGEGGSGDAIAAVKHSSDDNNFVRELKHFWILSKIIVGLSDDPMRKNVESFQLKNPKQTTWNCRQIKA